MTIKPWTYLISFTLFVMVFMALGGWVGYVKIAEHFLTQGYLDASSLQTQLLADQEGPLLRWEDRVALAQGGFASISASRRAEPLRIRFATPAQPQAGLLEIPLATNERTEDVRVDHAGRYLFLRILTGAKLKTEETTWLCKIDLQKRRLVRRSSVNPILLPVPFRP
jgi:hypothetical protein